MKAIIFACMLAFAACQNTVKQPNPTPATGPWVIYQGTTYSPAQQQQAEIKALLEKAMGAPGCHVHSDNDTMNYVFASTPDYYRFEAGRDPGNKSYFMAQIAKYNYLQAQKLPADKEVSLSIYNHAMDSIDKLFGLPLVPMKEITTSQDAGMPKDDKFEHVTLQLNENCNPDTATGPLIYASFFIITLPQTASYTCFQDNNLTNSWNAAASLGVPAAIGYTPYNPSVSPNTSYNFNDKISSIQFGFGMNTHSGTHRRAILYYYENSNFGGQCRSRALHRPNVSNGPNARQWRDNCLPNNWNNKISSVKVDLVL